MTTIKKHDIYKIRIKTPVPITYNTGDQQPAHEEREKFFRLIADSICSDKSKQGLNFKVNLYNLGEKTREEITIGGIKYPQSDEKLWALLYHDRIIAGMIETRTNFNHINFIYFQNLENLLNCPKP